VEASPYVGREQTQVKHRVLERYLSAFIPIVGTWAREIAYIDCLAGPWNSTDPDLGDTSFSKAIGTMRSCRAVLQQRHKSPTLRCLLIERDSGAFEKLNAFSMQVRDLDVAAKRWDFLDTVPEIVKLVGRNRGVFPFFFIDPKGWEALDTSILEPILAFERCEVLLTFMSSWITRFVSVEAKGFDRIFGSDLPRLRQLQGEELEEESVKSYVRQLKTVGKFDYVCALPILKPDQDAFHFFMIYCTRHIRGVEVFKETEKHVIPYMHGARAEAQERRRFAQSGQYSFLAPGAHYREAKFTQFQRRQVQSAKAELEAQLQQKRSILYDEAWATAMQHPGVMEDDVQEWIAEWKKAGSLRVTNQKTEGARPRKKSNQHLQLIDL
jgi:three-Cys-motif partner protein